MQQMQQMQQDQQAQVRMTAQQMQIQEAQERLTLLQLQALKRQYWERLFLRTVEMSDSELRAALKERAPDRRFAAAYVVGERLLEWQDDIIPMLEDRSEAVRQGARRSLIILSFLALNPEEAQRIRSPRRGDSATPLEKLNQAVDFGPEPRCRAAARAQAVKKWKEWWAAQRSPQLRTTDAPVASSLTEGERLGQALLQAVPESREEIITRYRDTKGVQYTEALAYAVARESGEELRRLRKVLDDRLMRMTVKTLGRYLEDEDAEIRRSAALALAARGNEAHVEALIPLLLDSQPAVERAAHAALCSLSGKDFGPRVNATEVEKREAAEKWRRWQQARR